jgi:hypothetical protein
LEIGFEEMISLDVIISGTILNGRGFVIHIYEATYDTDTWGGGGEG